MQRSWKTAGAALAAWLAFAAPAAAQEPDVREEAAPLVAGIPNLTLPSTGIRIFNDATNQQVFSQSLLVVPQPRGWGLSELGPTLAARTLSLRDTRVELRSDSTRQELLVFARDPSEHAATMFGLMPSLDAQGRLWDYDDRWADHQEGPDSSSTRVGLPFALGLTVPCSGCFFAPYPASVIDEQDWAFYKSAHNPYSGYHPSERVPGLSAPAGSGSVRALVLQDHGMCSQGIGYDTFGGQLPALWQKVKDFVDDTAVADLAERRFVGATSYLEHAVGQPNDVRGGMIVGARFKIEFTVGSVEIDATAKYRLKLDAGILAVNEAHWVQVTSLPGLAGLALAEVVEALSKDVPAQIHDAAASVQVAKIPATTLFAAKFLLKMGIAVSQDDLGLSDAEAQTLVAHIDDDANWRHVAADGSCQLERGAPAGSTGSCHFVVRAKRLNVYPDRFELVLFDGKELANPTYALYAAARGADALDPEAKLTSKLCPGTGTAPRPNDIVDWSQRRYFNKTLGFTIYDP